MTSVDATSVETEAVDSGEDGQSTESSDAIDISVSWTSGEHYEFRSFGIGCLLATVGLAGVAVLSQWSFQPGEWLSVDIVGSIGVLLLVAGPLAHKFWKTLKSDIGPVREQVDWSWISPIWVGCGMGVTGITLWAIDAFWATNGAMSIHVVPIFIFYMSLLVSQDWDVTHTIDPDDGVIETERPTYTKRRSLEYTVRVRRFDLLYRTLFVFSTRGKRWYKGPHFLSVPAALGPKVDTHLRRMVDRTDSPPRISRDERIIIGGVGASMLAIGPLLYLLSGEGALLLVAAGPSAIVAHFALMHAHRA